MDLASSMSIGEVARRAGVEPSAIRSYESLGLLPEPPRAGGKRRYNAALPPGAGGGAHFGPPGRSRTRASMEPPPVTTAVLARSVALFVVAGLMEIGGGYLVWLWLREARAVALGVLGGLLLFLYGVVPTLQPAHFGMAQLERT